MTVTTITKTARGISLDMHQQFTWWWCCCVVAIYHVDCRRLQQWWCIHNSRVRRPGTGKAIPEEPQRRDGGEAMNKKYTAEKKMKARRRREMITIDR